jgi:hypothetical protein
MAPARAEFFDRHGRSLGGPLLPTPADPLAPFDSSNNSRQRQAVTLTTREPVNPRGANKARDRPPDLP